MSDFYVGEIRAFAGSFAINGWAFCDGSLQAISQNATLFNLVGTTFGGDGQSTFALPNLSANLAVGQGQGPGLQAWTLGQTQGASTVTLTQQQVPAHNHTATFAANVQFTYETAGPTNQSYPGRLQKGTNYTAQTLDGSSLHSATISSQGGSQPHENTMPVLVMPYIISLFGVFPTQN